MSDTADSGSLVPPRDQYFPDGEGLTAWSPVFDRIVITPFHTGQRCLTVTVADKHVFSRLLSADEAAHIGRLLGPATTDVA